MSRVKSNFLFSVNLQINRKLETTVSYRLGIALIRNFKALAGIVIYHGLTLYLMSLLTSQEINSKDITSYDNGYSNCSVEKVG